MLAVYVCDAVAIEGRDSLVTEVRRDFCALRQTPPTLQRGMEVLNASWGFLVYETISQD
jgi:hypothetical protein